MFCLDLEKDYLLTYADLSLCGVKKTCSPAGAAETKGATERYGLGEIHRICNS